MLGSFHKPSLKHVQTFSQKGIQPVISLFVVSLLPLLATNRQIVQLLDDGTSKVRCVTLLHSSSEQTPLIAFHFRVNSVDSLFSCVQFLTHINLL
ncbi:hypothetical protein B9Z38_03900 [Limnohabitans sp. MMS-10A-160]|nr:hypothetical protein B9Z43_04540 [Limnohabitans sp. MMS-10A-192]PUE27427.1 hypothetical protein B9Z38_03900 [Limnohabitans sp. MMS-10A-160]